MKVNKPSAIPLVGSQYEAVRQRFENWRQIRKPCTPIPEDLWAGAVELAQAYGVSRTAQMLRLNYAALKQHLEASTPMGSAVPPIQPAFVELMPIMAAGMAECTIELERPGEAIMRIALKSTRLPDLEALARTFWGAKA
jgi:hypothetical protein